MMKKVLLIGLGKIGQTIRLFLSQISQLELITSDLISPKDKTIPFIKIRSADDLEQQIKKLEPDLILNAGPFYLSQQISTVALHTGASYMDLTEDVQATQHIYSLAQSASKGQLFAPQCGLAPGFISILAGHLCQQFEQLDSVHLRVGALPQYPNNQMLYNLTWSTDGLVNEYCNPCEVISQGQKIQVPALDSKEEFSLEGIRYEAFNTSGGLGTLPHTLAGKVNQLNYKTIRYPGHRDLMKFLLKDLKFEHPDRQKQLVDLLDQNIPMTTQDMVLIMVSVSGQRRHSNDQLRYEKLTDVRKIPHQQLYNQELSAIQISTAASICAIVELWLSNHFQDKSFLHQEDVSYISFTQTQFGRLLNVE